MFLGQIRVGLSEDELEEIADSKSDAVKVSSRDIPNVLARVSLIVPRDHFDLEFLI